ncbi:Pyridoxamine 5'-phosphate oxidase [Halopelagius inordinatus]|uniref:Pyridoxamine 5'-phosphate oxidase n=1 Tax=Halopelagius inordinatus TaxID=553467 RepID=A0A1I2M791_9EURY|nr:pyridoxamine 5'-phosphate oxidase family protein [Halopelagius inordinatus]SFF86750.1 Pyridoxamine 5'-phosphate oxidase [Halopelagius inordinatus]
MTTNEFAHVRGTEMTTEEVDEFLRERGIGVLSLAAGDDAYGVPLSFGYDGDRLYFIYLRTAETSEKERFTEQTKRASFTAFEVSGKHRWRSVVVQGEIRRVTDDEWDALVAAMDDNAWFPSAFSEAEPMQDLVGWTLEKASATGRRGDD